MSDQCQIWLANAEKTKFCGMSLAKCLYGPVDIYLTGEVGAGKTTFLDGFSHALGLKEPTKSPTYALENRYSIEKFNDFIHIDLYRLSSTEATELLRHSETHNGIRCIEWANKLPEVPKEGIHLHIEDKAEGRNLTVTFYDSPIPSDEQIHDWRQEVALPEHICNHCDAVAHFSGECTDLLLAQGNIVRKKTLMAAGRVHDLFRFIDFKKGAAHDPAHDPEEDPAVWHSIKEKYKGKRHEEACYQFLQAQRLPIIAAIVRCHGLRLPPEDTGTIEQKLLYYADKRMKVDEKVSLQERFEDFMNRYGNGEWSEDGRIWYEQATAVEQELFGLHPPR